MKVSRERMAEHRAAIVAAASKLFRERGFDQTTVAEVMKAAGLTHGAFYSQFDSKEALMAAALTAALSETTAQLSSIERGGMAAYAAGYASRDHLGNPQSGCPMAALGCDIPKQAQQVQSAFSDGVRAFLDAAADVVGSRNDATRIVAQLVGAMVLARAVTASDTTLADEILAASRQIEPPEDG
jgi:TetR/AcrR family transcriptional repressor of nem operon